ncbi:MAG: P1 family peptidase [Clostridiales bacterium]|nr:P1 family peptidase [Clostridiales bacterium]
MYNGQITDISGIEVGHAQNREGGTGCTVVLCRQGATAGVDVRGSAPGTRETDLMRPGNLVDKAYAILLAGGSAFGLAAADGVMRYLEENAIGFDTGVARVPIVGGAVLFDLAYKDTKARPDGAMGYDACKNAASGDIMQGSIGAGTGATVGKIFGMVSASKGGIGTASIKLSGGLVVGAIVAVNAFGDILDYKSGKIIAGARNPKKGDFIDTVNTILSAEPMGISSTGANFSGNTTIGVVATNAKLTKEQVNKLASISHDGLALAIRPVHTMADGDTMFALSGGELEGDFMAIGCAAVEVTARAIVNAVTNAGGME